jgi:hypothetical protein
MNKGIVWALFFILTAMQAMGNAFFAYTHLNNYQSWVELFGLVDSDPIEQKRILSIVSGAILPLVALGFIKSLVDYIRPDEGVNEGVTEGVNDQITDAVTQSNLNGEAKRVWEKVDELRKEGKLPEITEEDLGEEPAALAFTPYETDESFDDSDDNFEEESLMDTQIYPEPEIIEEPTIEETQIENDLENYPVYDKTNEIKNNGIENIMVFTKDGGQ